MESSAETISSIEMSADLNNNNNISDEKKQLEISENEPFCKTIPYNDDVDVECKYEKYETEFRSRSCFNQGMMRAVLHVLCSSSVAFQIGYTIGFSSSATKDFKENEHELTMTQTMMSWFGSIIAASAILGSLISVPLMKKCGKYPTILVCNLIFLLGWIGLASTHNYPLLFIGRFLTGVGMGFGFSVIPLYIGEMSPADIRGTLGALFNIVVAAGIPAAYGLGVFVEWRDMSSIGAGFAGFSLLLCATIPESPYWLAIHGKDEKARKIFCLIALDDGEETLKEIDERIQELKAMQNENSGVDMKTLKQPWIYKPLLLVLLYCVFQQLSGINAVIYNVHFIFHAAHFYNEDLASILVGLVQFVVMVVASGFMDKAGRKLMLIISSIGTCVCLLALGLALYFVPPSDETTKTATNSSTHEQLITTTTDQPSEESASLVPAWIALVSLMMYIMFFAIGLGPIPFILIGEMVPIQLNEFAGGISSVVNNLMALVVIQSFLSLTAELSMSVVMWGYSICCGLCALFTWKFLPEVKGKTLLEIQDIFRSESDREMTNIKVPITDDSTQSVMTINSTHHSTSNHHLST